MINIHAAVIHEIKKNPHTSGVDSVNVVCRQNLHQSNPLLQEFVRKIDLDARTSVRESSTCSMFSKQNTFGKVMSEYFTNNNTYKLNGSDYLTLSQELIQALSVRMSGTTTATGGHIPILWYSRDETEYLLIGLVNPSSGFTIDTNGIIVGNTNIDKEALRFSLRIKLEHLSLHHKFIVEPDSGVEEADLTPYARWTKKSDDIAHYFQEYLPTDQLLNNGEETRRYINLFNDYLDYVIPDTAPPEHKKVRFLIKQRVYRKMDQKRELNEVVRVEEDIVPIFDAMIDSYPDVFTKDYEVIPYYKYCEDNGCADYNSVFHPKKSDLDHVLNISVSVGDNLTIKGSKEGIADTTYIATFVDANNTTNYKLVSDMTQSQYNELKTKVPEIDVKRIESTNNAINTPES